MLEENYKSFIVKWSMASNMIQTGYVSNPKCEEKMSVS